MQDDTDSTAPTFDWKSITLAGLAAIVAVGLVGTALFPAYMPIRHYRIPDGHDSMQPTAPGGTHLVVTQWSIDTSAIARGDRVMFRYDETDTSYDILGRIVGLPGESVAFGPSGLRIGSANVERHGTDHTTDTGDVVHIERIGETAYEVTQPMPGRDLHTTTLDDDEFLVLPDHRGTDDFHPAYGPVSIDQIIGTVTWTSAPPTIVGKPQSYH